MSLQLKVWPDAVIAKYHEAGWWTPTTASDLARRNARQRPTQVAFYDDSSEPTTFQSLDVGADQIASVLTGLGVERGDAVAILLPDSGTLHGAWIGAERAGLVVVCIPSKSGPRDIAHLTQHAPCRVLITPTSLRGGVDAAHVVTDLRAQGWEGRHVTVTQRGESWSVSVDGGPPRTTVTPEPSTALTADELFMIVYTSGTTGRPKGVMQTMNRCKWMHLKCPHFREDDVFLIAVPATGGFGLWLSHLSPATLGAPAIVRSSFSPEQTLKDIEKYGVTVLVAVPTQLKMLLAHADFEHRDLSSLRILEVGGEPLPYATAEEFEKKTGAVSTQFYGSTESFSVAGPTKAEHPDHLRLGTTGQVIPESELVLLDDDGNRIPMPGRGRCASRGPGRTPGYFKDPEANAALFLDDGFVLLGDIIEVDEAGFVRVVGRVSDFILRGGLNISGPEVEDAVMMHPRVKNAAAVPMPDPILGERVCVYVVSSDGKPVTLEEITAMLAEQGYTKHKWPERLLTVSELPIAPGGKVAKTELKADLLARLGRGS